MRFRGYRQADLEAMFQLDAVCFSGPFQFDRLTMQQFAEEPGAIVIVVDEGKKSPAPLVAFMIVHLEAASGGPHAYIVTIDVLPSHRRLGVGAEMLDRAEAAARAAGASQMGLHVAAENLSAIAFYEHQGYRRTGIAKRFYREAGQDAIVFTKPL